MTQHQIFSRTTVGFATAAVAVTLAWISNANALCIGKKRARGSAQNSAAAATFCREYKAKNPNKRCIVDRHICPRGYVAAKKFKGCGINYASCVKGIKTKKVKASIMQLIKPKTDKLKDRVHKGRIRAAAWCKAYSKTTGNRCKYVKTPRVCPRGYRRFTKLKSGKIRNYKICIKRRNFGMSTKNARNNCNPRLTRYTKRATDWLIKHYDEVTGNFYIANQKRKNTNISRHLHRKFRNVTVVCHPANTSICAPKSIKRQATVGEPGKANICFQRTKTFCDLVGTLFHEVSGKATVRRSKIHNGLKTPDRRIDHVYRLGRNARDACIADGVDFRL